MKRVRSVAVVVAIAATFVGLPASAREVAPVAGVLVERVVSATLTLDSNGLSVSETDGFERRIVSGHTTSEGAFDVTSSGAPIGDFGCSGTGEGHRDHGAVRLEADSGGGAGRSLFHVYSLPGERGGPTTQVLICLAGGARPGQGERLLQAGVGAAYDGRDTRRLGMRWLTGPTPERGEDGYAFAGSEAGAGGFVEQTPVGELEGSFVGPFDSDFDDHFRNAVAGWWADPCLDGEGCSADDGSEHFQGSLAGGLWEFPDEGRHRFRVALLWAVHEGGEPPS